MRSNSCILNRNDTHEILEKYAQNTLFKTEGTILTIGGMWGKGMCHSFRHKIFKTFFLHVIEFFYDKHTIKFILLRVIWKSFNFCAVF